MKSATRRCSNCRKKVNASDALYGSLKAFCCVECLVAYAKSEKGKKDYTKALRKETAERKQKLKTKSDYVREAQSAFNRYVRLRDSTTGCISCGSMPEQKFGGTRDCGHMLSRGAHGQHKFRLDNTAGQCVACNRYRSGDAANFRAGMISRWGLDRIERLESDNEPKKFTIDYLKRVKDIFNRRANLYQRLFRVDD